LYRQELLPRYAQIGNDIHLEQRPGNWPDELVEDKRASVPDQVAAKLDVAAWFATLPGRMQHIAKQLACGFTTSEVAAQHRLPRGRVSQLRRELHDSWREFQAGAAPAMSFGDIHQWTPSAASRLRDVLQPGELFVVVRRHVAVR
jgi:hypothetical protein